MTMVPVRNNVARSLEILEGLVSRDTQILFRKFLHKTLYRNLRVPVRAHKTCFSPLIVYLFCIGHLCLAF
jgi:hypothetical protein